MQHRRISLALAIFTVIGGAALLTGGSRPAYAATITVTTTEDELNADGDCSLREAIQAANIDAAVDACMAGTGADTIVVPAGTYLLSITGGEDANATGDLDITGDLTINGAGATTTIIDGANLTVTPPGIGDRLFDIDPNGAGLTVEISRLSVRNGLSFDFGGGIRNGGTLTLTSVTISGNEAFYQGGGGIANLFGATLTLNDSTVSNNRASLLADGGGIVSRAGGTVTLNNSTLSSNVVVFGDGGGIKSLSPLILNNSTVKFNRSEGGFGGGISANTVTITNSTIRDNRATAINSQGGGISGGGTISGSTISDNFATFAGGGIRGGGTLNNSTVSGNGTLLFGGGIFGGGTLNNSTVSGNVTSASDGGGGINGTFTLKNTILANNGAGAADNNDCSGTITSAGHNLIEHITGCTIAGDTTGNITGSDPQLGPLANNGGLTQTHALSVGSPAIDAGSGDCPPPATDQRGALRPQGLACDIGAYEREPDADNDGIPDDYENAHSCLDPVVADSTADSDADGLTNFEEFEGADRIRGTGDETDPCDADTDDDGCGDGAELRPKSEVAQGGGRNPLYPWDYYDVNGDGVIDLLFDILGVIQHYQPIPGGAPPYDIVFDRGPQAGLNAWNMTAPDGVIDLLNDILGVIKQHAHNC